jgi:hypothetical protein
VTKSKKCIYIAGKPQLENRKRSKRRGTEKDTIGLRILWKEEHVEARLRIVLQEIPKSDNSFLLCNRKVSKNWDGSEKH